MRFFACGLRMTHASCHSTTHDTVAVSRNLACGGLTVLAVDADVDVHIGASSGGPRQPALAVHPTVTGKAHDQRRHGGRDSDHDRGDGWHDDWHRLGLRRSGAERPARHETSDQTDAPTPAYLIAHEVHPFPLSRPTVGPAGTIT